MIRKGLNIEGLDTEDGSKEKIKIVIELPSVRFNDSY